MSSVDYSTFGGFKKENPNTRVYKDTTIDYIKYVSDMANMGEYRDTLLFCGDPSKDKLKMFEDLLIYFSDTYKKVKLERPNLSLNDYFNEMKTDLYNLGKLDNNEIYKIVGINHFLPPHVLENIQDEYRNFYNTGHIAFDEKGDLELQILTYPMFPSAIRHLKNEHLKNELEGIITTDGLFYGVRYSHDTLIRLLTANNVDLMGAIRVSASIGNDIELSSMECYGHINENFEDDITIRVTDKQAKTLYGFFSNAKSINNLTEDFKSVLTCATNFGWQLDGTTMQDVRYYDDYVAKKNIDTFTRAVLERHPLETSNHRDQSVYTLLEEVEENNRHRRTQIANIKNANNQPSTNTLNTNIPSSKINTLTYIGQTEFDDIEDDTLDTSQTSNNPTANDLDNPISSDLDNNGMDN